MPETGFTWEKVAGSPDIVQTLAFVGSTLYVGTMMKGVFAYDGTSWRVVNDGLPETPVWVGNFHVTRAGSLLASMRFRSTPEASRTFRLSDGVWAESTGARNEYATFYASDRDGNILASTNTAGVLRSTDDGRTFQSFSHVPAVNGVSSSSFSIGNGLNNIIYLHSHDTGEFYSTDGGFTWNHLGSGSGPWGNQTALTSNTQGQLVAATGFGGIYRNRGMLTSPSMQMETNLQVSNDTGAHSLIRLGDGTLISHFIRLFCSKDGGATWTLCDSGIPTGTTSGSQNVQSLHTGDLAQGPDGKVYAGFLDVGVGVYRTTTAPQPPPVPEPPPIPPVPPVPPPTPAPTESPSNTRIPPATQIVDDTSGVWTIVEGGYILRNGESVHGIGSLLLWFNKRIYAIGTDSKWWRYEGNRVWTNIGSNDPSAPVPSPPPPPPEPTPEPEPEPPSPPPPCSISAPATVSIRRNSTGSIPVTLQGLTGPVEVKVVGSDGQVTVTELSWTANATSSVKQFRVRVKKQSRTIRFESPCGVAVVKVNVV